jgi:protein-S-isoprenylcysteine O-methyltransferase Ste14
MTKAAMAENPTTDPRKFPFPPGIPLAALLIGWGLGTLWPIPWDWPAWTRWAGVLLLIAPWSIAIWAMMTFRRHQTPVNPLGKVATIVTAGPFGYTRNPMYVSLVLSYIGGIFAFRLLWSAILLIPVCLALHYGVIVREERHLRAVFGEPYMDYCRRVRRWL